MKLLSTLFLACLFSYASVAQITIDPEVVLFEGSFLEFEVKPVVTNNTDEFTNIYWMFEKGTDFPDEWSVIVCDDTLCYFPNVFKSSPLFPNELEADSSFEFKFTVTPNGVAGSTYGIIHLYDDAECTNEVATSKMPITSVGEEVLQRLVLYPNPTRENFGIKEDDNVKSIEIYNNVGQAVRRLSHEKAQVHSIADLPFGPYSVVLRDTENKILKSLRLMKE